ncbi:tyrosine-type recombinase/integrase [Vibrio fluvialis]
MSIYHNLLSSRPHSYLIERRGNYYFSIRREGKIVRKSLYTDDLRTAQRLVHRIISNPLMDTCSIAMLKAIVVEQIKAFVYCGTNTPTQDADPVDRASREVHSEPVSPSSNVGDRTHLPFPLALKRWVADKASNLYKKSGGQTVLKKTTQEKISYLKYVFEHLWRHKALHQITSSDVDYALHVYSNCPQKKRLPWCNVSKEEQIAAAIQGDIPIEDRFSNSLSRVKTALKSFFDYYWRLNVIENNPMNGIRFTIDKKYNNRGKFSPRDTKKITRYCGSGDMTPLKAAIMLQLYAGLRNKEIEDLTPADIKTYRGYQYIHVRGTKTDNAERYIPIHPTLAQSSLLDHLKNGRMALLSSQMSYFFKKLMAKLQIRPCDENGDMLSFYSLRHSFATALAHSGASEVHIEWLMGHAHSGTKSKYIGKSVSHVPKLAKTVGKIRL